MCRKKKKKEEKKILEAPVSSGSGDTEQDIEAAIEAKIRERNPLMNKTKAELRFIKQQEKIVSHELLQFIKFSTFSSYIASTLDHASFLSLVQLLMNNMIHLVNVLVFGFHRKRSGSWTRHRKRIKIVSRTLTNN